MFSTLFLLVLLISQQTCQAAYCQRQPGPRQSNNLPIWSEAPTFLRQTKNAKLYEVGYKEYNSTIYLLHLYGSTQEMGFAQGSILKDEIIEFVDDVWNMIVDAFVDVISLPLPGWLNRYIASLGAKLALDLTYALTEAYTTPAYYVEMQALCDGAGRPDLFPKLRRIHMIGELTKGRCSMFGAWGAATAGGKTWQLRTLDWDFDASFSRHAALIVYHPSNSSVGNAFVNMGFTGWLGSLSGVNEYQLAISEIGVYFSQEPGPSFGSESRVGNPFTFVLRDILQFDHTLQDSINRLVTENRTCTLLLGVGDGKPEYATFRGFQYSYSVCNVVDDQNLIPVATWHPQINNIVYWGMDWNCVHWDERFSDLLKENYGKIDAETSIRNIIPGLTSGDLQVALYDLTTQDFYVAYGYINDAGTVKVNAFEKSFVKLNARTLFAEPAPQL